MVLRLSEATVLCPKGQEVISWLKKYKYAADKRIEVIENSSIRLGMVIYTGRNAYFLSVNEESNFLCCSVTCRRKRPGESWHRGNDIGDGDITKEALVQILGAIVFYEALVVVKNAPGDEPEVYEGTV